MIARTRGQRGALWAAPAPVRRRFGAEPRVFRAPGRVNLIGGHGGYNQGWGLTLAIDRDCFDLASARTDRRLRIHSREFDETVEAALTAPSPSPGEHDWSRYVLGVAWALGEIGVPVAGAQLLGGRGGAPAIPRDLRPAGAGGGSAPPPARSPPSPAAP